MSQSFEQQFKDTVRVSTPIIAVRTFDPSSAVAIMRKAFGTEEPKMKLILWDTIRGLKPINAAGKEEVKLIGAEFSEEGGLMSTIVLENTLSFVDRRWNRARTENQNNFLFLANAHMFMVPEKPAVIQGIWNLRNELKVNGNMLVLLMAPGAVLPKELVNDVHVLDEPLPTRDELAKIVERAFKESKVDMPEGLVLERVKDALVGLPAFGSDQSLAMNISAKRKSFDMDGLWDKKREIISATPGLSVWNGKTTLKDIGGSEQVIEFYSRLMTGPRAPSIILFLDEVEKQFAGSGNTDGHKSEQAGQFQTWTEDNKVMGGALVGVPGCGKTAIAQALAGEFGIPLITFDIAGMQDKYVGETNARMRAAFKTIDAIKGEGGRVLMIGTSNGLEGLALGLRRRFEFAPMYFFDVPTRKEKDRIWQIQLAAFGLDPQQQLPPDEGWTGAEIRNCCSKAEALGVSVYEARKWVVPVTQSEAGRIEAMRKAATGKMLSAAVPGHYHFDESRKEMFEDELTTASRKIRA